MSEENKQQSAQPETTMPAKTDKAVTPASEKKPSKFQELRGNKKVRLGIIIGLMAIVAVLFIVWEKARIFLAVAFIALLAALGLEVSNNDYDLGRMIQTGSVQESRINRDQQGNLLFDKLGNLTTDTTQGKQADDYNCDNFASQPEAQTFFQKVGGSGNDLNRLDGDKDGEACESLPKNPRREDRSNMRIVNRK